MDPLATGKLSGSSPHLTGCLMYNTCFCVLYLGEINKSFNPHVSVGQPLGIFADSAPAGLIWSSGLCISEQLRVVLVWLL